MERMEFRPLKYNEITILNDLFTRNNVNFDGEFARRLLDPSIRSKSVIFGCFFKGELVGSRTLYAYKICIAGFVKDAVTSTFAVIDESMRGKGLGIRLFEESTKYMEYAKLDLITAFTQSTLPDKWTNALNRCLKKYGYQDKNISTLVPCYRPYGSKLPEISIDELSLFRAKRLSSQNMKNVLSYAKKFYNRYYIAELPDKEDIRKVELFPDAYLWFKIEHQGRTKGYISCYQYLLRKGNDIQKQINFKDLIVDDIYLPGAVNAVIYELERLAFKPDVYIINNSSIIDNLFLYRTGFYHSFSRFHTHLRCRSNEKFIMDIFKRIDESIRFSLTII